MKKQNTAGGTVSKAELQQELTEEQARDAERRLAQQQAEESRQAAEAVAAERYLISGYELRKLLNRLSNSVSVLATEWEQLADEVCDDDNGLVDDHAFERENYGKMVLAAQELEFAWNAFERGLNARQSR